MNGRASQHQIIKELIELTDYAFKMSNKDFTIQKVQQIKNQADTLIQFMLLDLNVLSINYGSIRGIAKLPSKITIGWSQPNLQQCINQNKGPDVVFSKEFINNLNHLIAQIIKKIKLRGEIYQMESLKMRLHKLLDIVLTLKLKIKQMAFSCFLEEGIAQDKIQEIIERFDIDFSQLTKYSHYELKNYKKREWFRFKCRDIMTKIDKNKESFNVQKAFIEWTDLSSFVDMMWPEIIQQDKQTMEKQIYVDEARRQKLQRLQRKVQELKQSDVKLKRSQECKKKKEFYDNIVYGSKTNLEKQLK